MKIFPESIVPDPDKKMNNFDKSLIDKVNDDLLKSDKDMRLLKQDYRTGLKWENCSEIIENVYQINKNHFKIVFCKLSAYGKKPFDVNIHKEYLAHEKIDNLAGLEVELIYEWELGSILIFDRSHLHASSCKIEGKKIGVASFLKK